MSSQNQMGGSAHDQASTQRTDGSTSELLLYDVLTGLPNRVMYIDKLQQAIPFAAGSERAIAVLVGDLDQFKAVNDSLGYLAGDWLLQVIAERLTQIVKSGDIVARVGDDEFAIILSDFCDTNEVVDLINKIIKRVNEPVFYRNSAIEANISVGFTVVSDPDARVQEVIKRSNIALIQAKNSGNNNYSEFHLHAGTRIAERGQLGFEMPEAVRRGDFHLKYQPVVDAKSNIVVAFEALLRWNHPTKGYISPETFIPIAEENGLIVPLGNWALREACKEAVNWPANVRIAVNVSVVQVRRGGLEAAVLEALSVSGLPANRLTLEVTESVLMQDAQEVLACLHRLRTHGVRVALDDFGTGYSSLSYLRHFPFDKIKMDRSFIRDIANADTAAIVRAVVGIGERLGMGIVAEGVETAEQLRLVCQEGCVQIQGFLFSRPMLAEEARRYAATKLIPIE